MLITRLINNLNIVPKRNTNKIMKYFKEREKLCNWEGGKKYKGFTYYPRPGEVDPPYEPTKLFMVQRTGWTGSEYWCKNILFNFKLDRSFKESKVVIIKNTPTNCMNLWRVKHLVKITPITFPDGFPEEGDVFSTKLNHKGELRIHKSLKVDSKRLEETEKKEKEPVKFNGMDLKRQSIQTWRTAWKTPFEN